MSLSSTTDRVTYSGDASTTAFSFPYKFFADADLVVLVKVNSTGVETTQTITTHYTVSGSGVEAGGTVTFLTAPASGTTVIIYRDKSAIQELDVTENGKIPSENLEKQLDKLTMMVQRIKNKLVRTIGLKEGFTASFDPSLPAIMVNDGYLKTNSSGTSLEYVAEQDLINTISIGSQAFTASRALVSDANGIATPSATTSTEIGYVSGVTSAIQDQLNAKVDDTDVIAINQGGTGETTASEAFDALSPMTNGGDLIYGGASGTGSRLANGSAGQVLTSAGGTNAPVWSTMSLLSSYTPTYNGLGTPTGVTANYYRIGANGLVISVTLTSGTVTAAEMRVALPTGATSIAGYPTLQAVGMWARGVSGVNKGGFVLIEPSVGYVTFSISDVIGSSSANPVSKANGNSALSSSELVSFTTGIIMVDWA